jgi:hypothetical protein
MQFNSLMGNQVYICLVYLNILYYYLILEPFLNNEH